MEIKIYDPNSKDKFISWDDFIKKIEEEDSKKNFRNWFNKHFKPYASYNAYYILTHPQEILKEWQRQIKWGWQRLFRGWDDRVVWSIDWYLAEKIPKWLEQLKMQENLGVPMMMFEDKDFDKTNGNISDEIVEIRKKDYIEILDKIAYGFRCYIIMQDRYDIESDEYKQLKENFEIGFDLLKKYFSAIHD